MKKLLIITILALVGIIFSNQKAQAQMTLNLQNNTYMDFPEIYYAEPSTENWSSNIVDDKGMYELASGDWISFNLPYAGTWDLAFGDGNGNYCYFRNITIEGYNNSFGINSEDISNCFY